MFRVKSTVLCVCGAFGLAGCGSLGTSNTGQPWAVQPAFRVNHAVPNSDALYRIGRFYQGQRRYAEAIAAYRRALSLDPGYAEAQNGLGVVYAEQGRYSEAVKSFEAAIATSPRAAHLHNNLGYILLLQGAEEKAVEVLEEARRLEPDNAKVRDNLVIGYERLIERRNARRPVQPDTNTAIASEAQAQSGQASVEVRTAPDSGVKLVAVAPDVYELQAPGVQRKHGSDSAVPAATVASPTSGSAAHTYAPSATSGVKGIRVHAGPATPEASGSTREAAGPDEARQQGLQEFKLEVSNGNGVDGFAARVAGYLERFGVSTGRLTNASTFAEPTTVIQYREGYRMQAARIGAMLPKPVAVVQAGTLRSDVHVRLMLGRDVRNDVALFHTEPSKMQLAAEPSERTTR